MATPFRVCFRFEPQQAGCQTFDWCTNVDLDRDTIGDAFARAEFFLAQAQAKFYQSSRFSRTTDCEYAIVMLTAFPGE